MSDRDDFEKWADEHGYSLETGDRNGGKYYLDQATADLRSGWIAAVENCKQVETANLDTFIGEVSQNIAELPDRNSPEDWPEAMLVTHDELKEIITAVHADFPLFAHAMPKSDDCAYSKSVLAAWQACQRLNDARINTLNDAITEDKILESHNRELLAVIAKKDEELKILGRGGEKGFKLTAPEVGLIADEALAIQPGDIALVEVGNVCFEDTLVGVDLTNANVKHGDKVYVLQKKEGANVST